MHACMGDKPWQHEQQALYSHARMIQQASISAIHGGTIGSKDPGGYDMADFDQALFLYLNNQDDQASVIQQHPQTLNIFPSQPMHVLGGPAPNHEQGSMATNNMVSSDASAGPSKRPLPSSSLPSSTKPTPAVVKREGSSSKGGSRSSKPSTSDHQEGPKTKTKEAKTLRRLAQNREAARKSRLRKKAYIQNLETSRIRLSQLEQELHRSRSQGAVVFGGGTLSGSGIGTLSPEAAWFDAEHARWTEEHGKIMRHLRAALDEEPAPHADGDAQVRQLVGAAAAHHGVLAELKAAVARADAFHLASGTWVSAAERCFLWIAGFRPSELIKVAARHAEPLTEPQAMGVCGLQQWAREAEAVLDHELHAMHRSVSEAVSPDAAALLCPYPDVPGYMATMSLAVAKLASLETFVRQADALRLQMLHRLPQILTARQSARCFLAIADYSHRLRALSELWHTRPRQEEVVTVSAAGSSHRPSY